jgi:GNAT superfamily N-acetyltransferase
MSVPMDSSASVSAPRRLESSDRPAILDHLLRLSVDARQMRFCQVMSDEAVRTYAAKINFERDVCIGVFDQRANLVALVQGFGYEENGARLMEAAFSTDEPMRRRGLGTLLFAEITDCALAAGVDLVIAQCLTKNRQMRMLLLAIGATCEVEDGEVIGHLYPATLVRPHAID